jgi:hypothetical protein
MLLEASTIRRRHVTELEKSPDLIVGVSSSLSNVICTFFLLSYSFHEQKKLHSVVLHSVLWAHSGQSAFPLRRTFYVIREVHRTLSPTFFLRIPFPVRYHRRLLSKGLRSQVSVFLSAILYFFNLTSTPHHGCRDQALRRLGHQT